MRSFSVEKNFYKFEYQFSEFIPRAIMALNIDLPGHYVGLSKKGEMFHSSYIDEKDVEYFDEQGRYRSDPNIVFNS